MGPTTGQIWPRNITSINDNCLTIIDNPTTFFQVPYVVGATDVINETFMAVITETVPNPVIV